MAAYCIFGFSIALFNEGIDEFLELLVSIGEPHRAVVELFDELVGAVCVEGHVVHTHQSEQFSFIVDVDIGENRFVSVVVCKGAFFGLEVVVSFGVFHMGIILVVIVALINIMKRPHVVKGSVCSWVLRPCCLESSYIYGLRESP